MKGLIKKIFVAIVSAIACAILAMEGVIEPNWKKTFNFIKELT